MMKEKIEKAKNNNLEIELSKNSAKGITLISLVITIILLIQSHTVLTALLLILALVMDFVLCCIFSEQKGRPFSWSFSTLGYTCYVLNQGFGKIWTRPKSFQWIM